MANLYKEIYNYKDCCVDGISTFILKVVFGTITEQLQHLFNMSFKESVFPKAWAKGFINILPKGGNLKDPSN